MSYGDLIYKQFEKAFFEARDFYESEQYEKAHELCAELLANDAMPRYFRMKILLIFAISDDNWHREGELIDEADALWKEIRAWYPTEGPDADLTHEEALAEVRKEIDAAIAEHIANDPSKEGEEDPVAVAQAEANLFHERAENQYPDDTAKALYKVYQEDEELEEDRKIDAEAKSTKSTVEGEGGEHSAKFEQHHLGGRSLPYRSSQIIRAHEETFANTFKQSNTPGDKDKPAESKSSEEAVKE